MGDFFVRRPIVAMVMAIFMVIIGVVFLSGLPMEQYPDITPPYRRGSSDLYRCQCSQR